MNKDEFNLMFDDAFDRASSEHEVDPAPDYHSTWMKTQRKIFLNQQRQTRIKRLQYTILIAASIFIGAIVFSGPLVSTAIDPIVVKIIEVPDRFVQVVFNQDESVPAHMKNSPPKPTESSEKSLSSKTSQVDIETAQKLLKVDIPYPSILPKGYTFEHVTLFHEKGFFTKRATFQYRKNSTHEFTIEIHSLDNNHLFDAHDAFEVSNLENGTPMLIFYSEEYDSKVQFQDKAFKYEVLGDINRDEAVQMIESMDLILNR